ncbi:N-acetylmuramic acid 6-phosphate etherase [Allocatelliglobosispora scoriae]|uniref:N-acetylmuramic acid 6-phosphate etherase n=1 Tax=Allocatelliglobosispora scoriae TaxID=643052 RepID=A0A841BPF6_9ACTN|nr:N-acetylmuramic acid 6-phosphate etherase [Allocatelliglobosispora scoriae]MBB5868711.1 N-acetylmuramic acid 6-phosphate etherase [Allocatelliglobosispora scoriae]
MTDELARLVTEQRLPGLQDLDRLSTPDLVRLMNEQDSLVAAAVALAAPRIAAAVDAIADRMRRGGRLVYIGAGTAGRIGVLDASECAVTFGTTADEVCALIAGGPSAMITAAEGAEDSCELAVADLTGIGITEADAVVGISASGRTPYAVEALRYAGTAGAFTVGIACNADSPLGKIADVPIEVVVGPEFVAGSTRLKAGTAQKLVCNMISTLTMIRVGRTYGDLMVHLTATNDKLWARAHRLVATITGCPDELIDGALRQAGGSVTIASIMLLAGVGPADARERFASAAGDLRAALAH